MKATFATKLDTAVVTGAVETRRAQDRGAIYTGRVLTGLAVLSLAFDAGVKLLMLAPAPCARSESSNSYAWPRI